MFSGIDGSGKSAHARKLADELISYGKSVKYLWMRGQGRIFFSFPLLTLCRLLRITKVHRLKSGIRISEYLFHAYKPLCLLWPWLQLIDSLIYSVTHVYVHLFLSSSFIIVERSVIDTFVDVLADVHNPFGLEILHKLFLALLPKNSLIIILDSDEKVALSRKEDILHIDYLRVRRRLYKSLQRRYGWHLVSTEPKFEAVHDLLMKLTEKDLKMACYKK